MKPGEKMRTVMGLAGMMFTLSLSGCSTFFQSAAYSDYGVGALTLSKESAPAMLRDAIVKKSATDTERFIDAECFNVPVDASKAVGCQQQRNMATFLLLSASDAMCQSHLKTIFGNEASFNIISGTIANLASGWATVTSGLAAKSAMSALSLFANAERSLVNETVYKNLLVTAVTAKIREAREAKAAAIIPGNLEKDINKYPVMRAVYEVSDYHYTCSFMFGLEKALKEGIQPTLETRKAKLEQDKQTLELYVETRKTKVDASKDNGIIGANKRIDAIEAELLTLIKVQK
jgi:hypothetical protein